MKKLSTKGFGAIETILIIIIIGIIGSASYFVYNSQKKTNQSLDNASNSLTNAAQANQKKTEETNDKNSTNSDEGLFVIKEWGVKFKPTDKLNGLYYTVGNENSTVYFSLDELKNTDCAADKTAQVALSRYTEQDFAEDEQLSAIKDEAKKIGNYYYLVIGGQASCSEDSKIQSRATELRTEIVQLLPNGLIELQ